MKSCLITIVVIIYVTSTAFAGERMLYCENEDLAITSENKVDLLIFPTFKLTSKIFKKGELVKTVESEGKLGQSADFNENTYSYIFKISIANNEYAMVETIYDGTSREQIKVISKFQLSEVENRQEVFLNCK